MKCETIMKTPPTHLYVDTTVGEAIDVLIERHMYNVPVVDRNDIFVGEISSRRLIGLLLPTSMTMDLGLKNVGFVRESHEELHSRLKKVKDHPISRYLATDIAVVYPDSPVIDALMLLYKKYIRIAVVDRGSRRLVGGISFITILRAIEKFE